MPRDVSAACLANQWSRLGKGCGLTSDFEDVRILLPVWGERYRESFLRYCLPSLLAAENLPALAGRARCSFVLMCRSQDANVIAADPLWRSLSAVCSTEITLIDDLVSEASAVTLTLAYTRGLRAVGDRLTRTVFFFLLADYLLADGALTAGLSEIASGADGVLTGNFVVDLDSCETELEALRQVESGRLTVPPRQLVDLGLRHLHAESQGNLVEDNTVATGANRLFWTAGPNGLVGRFFLMHMFAIRPETAAFEICAPCDYSFIPALCPSGHIAVVKESDRLCLVELQRARPSDRQASARVGPAQLARDIGAWATPQHRNNARHTIRFCGTNAETMVDSTGQFIDDLLARLPATAPGHIPHPLWAQIGRAHV